MRKSLTAAASLGARNVALTALATGYSRLSMGQFAEGIRPLLSADFPPVDEVIVCARNESDQDELAAAVPLTAGTSGPLS